MFRKSRSLFVMVVLLSLGSTASAFSLLGPFTSWMNELNYNWNGFTIGGPMNLGEEYRWNIPVITYGFDLAFIDYFGTNGVAEVEKAIQMLNDLPAASEMNLEAFPLNTSRKNFKAEAWNLIDLKSAALAALMEQLGLAQSERYVWCLRDRWVFTNPSTTNYLVIQRNFDPYTWLPSSSINDTRFTYQVREYAIPFGPTSTLADAFEFPADPLAANIHGVSGTFLTPGNYFTNLTRDDAGGLRYLLSAANINAERLIPGVRGAGTDPANYVDAALRPGVEKITFVRVSYDSILDFSGPFTNRFTDTYLSNGVPVQQTMERVATRPDILFSARDLPNRGYDLVVMERSDTSGWLNNAALNGSPAAAGPGVINPSVTITFNRLGPTFFNSTPFFLDQNNISWLGTIWGSFDGTTNLLVVYPVGFVTPVPLTLNLKVQSAGTGRQLEWHVLGSANARYRFESSRDLINWTPEATFTNTTGVMSFTAPGIDGVPFRFYRVRQN